MSQHKLFWLPNALTLGRIALVPFLIWAILAVSGNTDSVLNAPYWLLGLFVICALSDFLDGFLARRWKLVSDFGRMLDPIADKLLVAGCLIAFNIAFAGLGSSLWMILVPSIAIIFRDIFISGTREHAANAGIILAPTKLAKWKTAAEMLAIMLMLVGIAAKNVGMNGADLGGTAPAATHIGIGILWLAAILSVYTGLFYIKSAFPKGRV